MPRERRVAVLLALLGLVLIAYAGVLWARDDDESPTQVLTLPTPEDGQAPPEAQGPQSPGQREIARLRQQLVDLAPRVSLQITGRDGTRNAMRVDFPEQYQEAFAGVRLVNVIDGDRQYVLDSARSCYQDSPGQPLRAQAFWDGYLPAAFDYRRQATDNGQVIYRWRGRSADAQGQPVKQRGQLLVVAGRPRAVVIRDEEGVSQRLRFSYPRTALRRAQPQPLCQQQPGQQPGMPAPAAP